MSYYKHIAILLVLITNFSLAVVAENASPPVEDIAKEAERRAHDCINETLKEYFDWGFPMLKDLPNDLASCRRAWNCDLLKKDCPEEIQ